MNKKEFKKLTEAKIIYLDGATGTNLQKRGLPTGVCPEKWILEHMDVMIELQKSYIDAGSNIIYAPTFTGNRIKLREYGLEKETEQLNKELVALSKSVAGDRAFVAGDLTMTGEQLYPAGTLLFEELVDAYKEQIHYLVEAGVDLLVIETMMSLQESRAALIAASETCDLPVMVTMTFNEDGRTLFGTDPATAVIVLQGLGADAVGVNCSTGPDQMIPIVEEMKRYANVPIIAKPNAGLPDLDEQGQTVFDMNEEEFAYYAKKLVEAGAGIIGGCCGTTPTYIERVVKELNGISPLAVTEEKRRVLCSERMTVDVSLDGKFMVVGERINPTGKKLLQEELRQGKTDLVVSMALEQEENGASILDVNMGMNGIDEKEMMLRSIYALTRSCNVPLCIDSSHIDVIEAALRIYPGRALINSISLEKGKAEVLLPMAKKYGAMFILLPLSEHGLPADSDEKKQIIHDIIEAAEAVGLSKSDIIVDGLVATVGANPEAALDTLETIRYCKSELNVATITGLSNISFGLPDRAYINSTFLTMTIASGLTMAIANPSQELLVKSAYAADLLLNKKGADIRYINKVNSMKSEVQQVTATQKESKPQVYEAVLKGNRDSIVDLTKQELNIGKTPDEVMNECLIPAINEVGELFNKKIYFLPQLIASAEAMKTAIGYLEPMLEKKDGAKSNGTVIIATVEGDIHDIGKNLVSLMLRNYGYQVIDLGKDVPKEKIAEAAIEYNADIIALSALMTTTMMKMKEFVAYAKEKQLRAKVIIGGAVITQGFADEIGADGYSRDAADAVNLVKSML